MKAVITLLAVATLANALPTTMLQPPPRDWDAHSYSSSELSDTDTLVIDPELKLPSEQYSNLGKPYHNVNYRGQAKLGRNTSPLAIDTSTDQWNDKDGSDAESVYYSPQSSPTKENMNLWGGSDEWAAFKANADQTLTVPMNTSPGQTLPEPMGANNGPNFLELMDADTDRALTEPMDINTDQTLAVPINMNMAPSVQEPDTSYLVNENASSINLPRIEESGVPLFSAYFGPVVKAYFALAKDDKVNGHKVTQVLSTYESIYSSFSDSKATESKVKQDTDFSLLKPSTWSLPWSKSDQSSYSSSSTSSTFLSGSTQPGTTNTALGIAYVPVQQLVKEADILKGYLWMTLRNGEQLTGDAWKIIQKTEDIMLDRKMGFSMFKALPGNWQVDAAHFWPNDSDEVTAKAENAFLYGTVFPYAILSLLSQPQKKDINAILTILLGNSKLKDLWEISRADSVTPSEDQNNEIAPFVMATFADLVVAQAVFLSHFVYPTQAGAGDKDGKEYPACRDGGFNVRIRQCKDLARLYNALPATEYNADLYECFNDFHINPRSFFIEKGQVHIGLSKEDYPQGSGFPTDEPYNGSDEDRRYIPVL
ncbi:hypothetical protein BJ085DRAFT_29175 [Dimargaris cristalligena]|uniref:Uncharacterized protein n=1 Tax=Dimargaris cristalligena TaxID=215637 RepID=A0A4P9ZNV3_9FUNG|nr:hypothetical protein BJ085DRAFT_29175 [Dimargaris cristalligena]|eukprot:RKP34301.1 hypothetical protein BJ085DRAFT_29175 [Dimargaris cristalligena]